MRSASAGNARALQRRLHGRHGLRIPLARLGRARVARFGRHRQPGAIGRALQRRLALRHDDVRKRGRHLRSDNRRGAQKQQTDGDRQIGSCRVYLSTPGLTPDDELGDFGDEKGGQVFFGDVGHRLVGDRPLFDDVRLPASSQTDAPDDRRARGRSCRGQAR